MKNRNIDKNLKNNLNKSISELLDTIENVTEDLETYISLNFDSETIDEEDPLVKLYRSIGQVGYTIDCNEELCDIVYNDENR